MASIKENNLELNYGWPYGESGWNSGMDENIVKLGFESRKRVNGILSSPPSSPSNGDAYIVGTAPTGLFSGKFANIAIYDRGSWVFITPKSQEVVFNTSDGCDYIYNNGWSLKLEAEVSPYIKIKDFTFSTGYTITDQKQCLLNITDNHYYQWNGTLPKVVAASSTPETTGGIGVGAWSDKTDLMLRSDINIVQKRFACVADLILEPNIQNYKIVETLHYYDDYLGGGKIYDVVPSSNIVYINGRQDQPASYYVDGFGVFQIGGYVLIPRGKASFRSWGCISDSITYSNVGSDSSAQAQALINFCAKSSQVAYVENGKYYVHNLVNKKVYTGTDATGGSQVFGVSLIGESRESTFIYTFGNDFIDVYDVYSLVAANITIASDRVRVPSLGSTQGKCLYSSAPGGYVRPLLFRVDIQRFEYGVYSPTGSWSSIYNECFFTYCKTGLKIERSYGSSVTKCSFICQTAIDCSTTLCDTFEISNNQFALGTYCSIFGGDDTTLKLYVDNITIRTNYFEAYAPISPTSVIFDIKLTQTAFGSISEVYINAAAYSPIIRRISGVSAGINSNIEFSKNRYIVTGTPKIWEDVGDTNVPIYIKDDKACTKVSSNIIAINQQTVASRKYGISIATGQTSIIITDYIDSASCGDATITGTGLLVLPVGHFSMSVYSRYSSTADITLRLSKSGVNVDFKIASNGTGVTTVVQTILNIFPGGWTASLVNSLVSGAATLNDLVINIVPVKVGNTRII